MLTPALRCLPGDSARSQVNADDTKPQNDGKWLLCYLPNQTPVSTAEMETGSWAGVDGRTRRASQGAPMTSPAPPPGGTDAPVPGTAPGPARRTVKSAWARHEEPGAPAHVGAAEAHPAPQHPSSTVPAASVSPNPSQP